MSHHDNDNETIVVGILQSTGTGISIMIIIALANMWITKLKVTLLHYRNLFLIFFFKNLTICQLHKQSMLIEHYYCTEDR